MRILDLTRLQLDDSRRLNRIAADIRSDFNELVSGLLRAYGDDLDWLLGSVPSRNTFLSPLFVQCCHLAMVRGLLESSDPVDRVVVGSRGLANSLSRYVRDSSAQLEIVLRRSLSRRAKDMFRPLAHFARGLDLSARRWWFSRRLPKTSWDTDEGVILISTYVLPSSLRDGNYHDRYFPGILEHVPESEKRRIYFVPEFIGFENPNPAMRAVSGSDVRFLLKDPYLKLSDYLFALSRPLRLSRLRVPPCRFRGFNIGPIVREELYRTSASLETVKALLNYRFIQRLSAEGISPRRVVGWYENQVTDRGMILGLHHFFPEVKVIGYQGFIISPEVHIYIHPTPAERELDLVPEEVAVVGRALVDRVREFDHNLRVRVAPAFRFQGVWNDLAERVPSEQLARSVLVVLPIGEPEMKQILSAVKTASEMFVQRGMYLRFLVKPHPTLAEEELPTLLDVEWPSQFHVVGGDFHSCLSEAGIVVGNSSSTCVEAIARGRPVVIIGNPSGLTQNPVPNGVPSELWTVCYTHEETAQAIMDFSSRSESTLRRHRDLGCDVRELFFEKVTPNTVAQLLGTFEDSVVEPSS